MPPNDTRPLQQAFEQTDYHIHAGDRRYTVAIGSPCPAALRRWLSAHCRGPCAWIVTACNPRARLADADANAQRQAAMTAWLDAAAFRHVPAENRARAGDWPIEPGVCLLDMDEGLARSLALRFDQTALVAVPVDAAVQLVWVDDPY